MRPKLYHYLILSLILLFPITSTAHPHVFLDTRLDFQFKQESLDGFWVEWLFDEIFTASIRMDYDADRNNQFDADEIEAIRQGAFSNLRHFNYFTYVKAGKQLHKVTKVNSFSAKMSNNRLVYRFFVPWNVPATQKTKNLIVAIYDESFYCDIEFRKKKFVQLIGGENLWIQTRKQMDASKVIEYDNRYQTASRSGVVYGGVTNPYEISLKFRKK